MKYKVIGCDALARMIYLGAAYSPHIVDVELLPLGLHKNPSDLRQRLQERVDVASKDGYDAILMAYGLCGRSTAGLEARQIPLVIPRAHDCITLFLGGRARYQQEQEKTPGTYWYVLDYIQRGAGSGTSLSLGSDDGMTGNIDDVYEEYVKKYGKDNADYLMEVMGEWKSHYQRAAYIDLGFGGGEEVEQKARDEAQRRGWRFERIAGDMVLIRRLLNGDWDDDFLVLHPGQKVRMAYDSQVICPEME